MVDVFKNAKMRFIPLFEGIAIATTQSSAIPSRGATWIDVQYRFPEQGWCHHSTNLTMILWEGVSMIYFLDHTNKTRKRQVQAGDVITIQAGQQHYWIPSTNSVTLLALCTSS